MGFNLSDLEYRVLRLTYEIISYLSSVGLGRAHAIVIFVVSRKIENVGVRLKSPRQLFRTYNNKVDVDHPTSYRLERVETITIGVMPILHEDEETVGFSDEGD